MALTALPSDCLLACLARVPYVDLRNTIPSTCKSLRDAVTSAALRKTREAAGWTEWAVFAGRPTIRSDCYIITASGARRTVRRSHVYCEDALRASLSSDQDEVVLMECENGSVRASCLTRARIAGATSAMLLVRTAINSGRYRAAAAVHLVSIMVRAASERIPRVRFCPRHVDSPTAPIAVESIEVVGGSGAASEDHLQARYMILRLALDAGPRLPFGFMTEVEEFIGTRTFEVL